MKKTKVSDDSTLAVMREAGFYELSYTEAEKVLELLERTYHPRVRTDETLLNALKAAIFIVKSKS